MFKALIIGGILVYAFVCLVFWSCCVAAKRGDQMMEEMRNRKVDADNWWWE